METKVCAKCGQEKELSEYSKSFLCLDGYLKTCKSCITKLRIECGAKRALKTAKEKERTKLENKIYREKLKQTPEERRIKRNLQKKEYRKNHPEIDKQYYQTRYLKTHGTLFIKKPPEHKKEMQKKLNKKWVKKHPDYYKKMNKENSKNLVNSYIAKHLHIPTKELKQFPGLIELKRQSILLTREIKQLS